MRFLPLRNAAWILAAVLASAAAGAVDQNASLAPVWGSSAPDSELPGAAVRLEGRILFKVRGSTSLPAPARAEAISDRIETIARDPALAPESITIITTPIGEAIMAGNTRIMTVLPSDGEFEAMRYQAVAENHARKLREAIATYRWERDPRRITRGVVISAVDTALLIAGWWLVVIGFRRMETRLALSRSEVAGPMPPKRSHASELTRQAEAGALHAARWAALLALLYVWLHHVLAQIPATRWLSDNLARFVVDPVVAMGEDVADYLPKLIFLVVLTLLTRYGLRLLRLYFSAVELGTARLRNFEPEWSIPTYKLIRTAVIGLAMIMGYPYLPGSGTDALKGLSLFAGLLFSLGASTAISGIISGYINTFGRVFKAGDLIQVGEVRGIVTTVRLMTTRVRTVRNEEVTIPNSTITSTSLINYSALAREHGLILQTQVGIGYEVPWRQVHAMLKDAAARTPELLTEPAPFVYQWELGDFAITYQLNVYKRTAEQLFATRSILHQNILDVFNENGVQIMTPAYEGDPAEPKVVAKERWFTPLTGADKDR